LRFENFIGILNQETIFDLVKPIYDKNNSIVGSEFAYPHVRTLRPDLKSTFKMTSSIDNFKGMKYYEISLQWKKPDGSQGYLENAKIFKQKHISKSK